MIGVYSETLPILHDLPDHGVGDQVAVVGLAVTVAVGGLRAVELHLALGKDGAVFGHDPVDDGLRGGGHFSVALIVGDGDILALGVFLGMIDGEQLVFLDLLGGVVNDDEAHIGKGGAGRLDGLAVFALGHDGVGVAVDDEVDALHLGIQIIGAIGLGFGIHAQMRQTDHQIGVLQGSHLRFGGGVEGLVRGKLQALDQRRVRLGLGLGGLHAEEAELDAGLGGVGGITVEDGLAVGIEHIGAQDLELGLLHVFRQLGVAVVELMVAQSDHIIAGGVHHGNGVGALGGAYISGALAVIAGVYQDHFGALRLILRLQRSHIGIAGNRAMDIVGMEDHGLARHRGGGSDDGVFRKGGDGQRKDHGQGQEQRKEFPILHGISLTFFLIFAPQRAHLDCTRTADKNEPRKAGKNEQRFPGKFGGRR